MPLATYTGTFGPGATGSVSYASEGSFGPVTSTVNGPITYTLNAVPEPASLALALGFTPIALRRRRSTR